MPRRAFRRCTVPGCGLPYYSTGFCESHYRKKRRLEGPRCSIPGCNRRVSARGLCRGHRKDPTRTIRAATAGRGGSRVLAKPRPALTGRRGCHAGAWLAWGTIRDRLQQWPVRVEAIPAPVATASIRLWSDGPDCPDLGGSSRLLDRGCGQRVHRVPLVEREISRPRRSQCACIS